MITETKQYKMIDEATLAIMEKVEFKKNMCEKVRKLFEKHDNEYMMFDLVTNPQSKRPDLNAFMILDSLFPSPEYIIGRVKHDMFYLNVTEEQISTLTEEKVIELIRCGMCYSSISDQLMMLA